MDTTITKAPSATRLALGFGGRRHLLVVQDLAEASRIYREVCCARLDSTGQGATGMPEGRVYDTTGAKPKVVARVSWNGRVWPNKTWKPGVEPLFDPYAKTTEGGVR